MPLSEQAQLVREIDAAHHKIDTHERECALRYQGIATDMSHVKEGQDRLEKAVAAVQSTLESKAAVAVKVGWSLNWKAWAVAGFLISTLIAALGWSVGQVYQLQTAQHAQVTKP